MTITQIKSMVQFARGNSLTWAALVAPIPAGVVVFSLDDGVFKLGNGVATYQALPVLFTFSDLISAQGGASGLFETPVVADQDKIVMVSLNTTTARMEYTPSNVTLTSILTAIVALETQNTSQDIAIANLLTKALSIDASINTASNGKLVVISNGRFSASNQTVADVQAAVLASNPFIPGPHLDEPIFYTTINKNVVIDKLSLMDKTTYFVEVVGFHDNTDTPVFGLTSSTTGVTITKISTSFFSVAFDVTGTHDDRPVILNATIDDGSGNSLISKAIPALVMKSRILVGVYGGSVSDGFRTVAVDSANNIICVGVTNSEGVGNYDGLVVKFDSNFNILAKKRYGGSSYDDFRAVVIDSDDNIIVVGYTDSENKSALIVKFDSDLNVLDKKKFGGTATLSDVFWSVAIDSADNIICCGYTTSETAGVDDALVVKFDNNLNIIAKKRYGASGFDRFRAVAVDSADNIICIGDTKPDEFYDGLIVKFDSNLDIIVDKFYSGAANEYLFGATIDSADNIIVVGTTESEGSGIVSAMILKFDVNLNLLIRKTYSGTGTDAFYKVKVDSEDNIICAGYTDSEGLGGFDALVVKFTSSLTPIFKKRYGGTGHEYFYGVTIDSADNIICSGQTASEGISSEEALLVKLPVSIPTGTLIGTILTNLTFAGSNLTLADSGLTLSDSTLTLNASALTLANSTLTIGNSNLTREVDILN